MEAATERLLLKELLNVVHLGIRARSAFAAYRKECPAATGSSSSSSSGRPQPPSEGYLDYLRASRSYEIALRNLVRDATRHLEKG